VKDISRKAAASRSALPTTPATCSEMTYIVQRYIASNSSPSGSFLRQIGITEILRYNPQAGVKYGLDTKYYLPFSTKIAMHFSNDVCSRSTRQVLDTCI